MWTGDKIKLNISTPYNNDGSETNIEDSYYLLLTLFKFNNIKYKN